MIELVTQQKDIKSLMESNPWRVKFVRFFVGNRSDIIQPSIIRKRLGVSDNEEFEVGVAKYLCMKKIELGIVDDKYDVSYQHALHVTRKLQVNVPRQGDVLVTFLLSMPTDEAISYLRIVKDKEKVLNADIVKWIKEEMK